MSNLQAIADRFEIETPRGEFTDAGKMHGGFSQGGSPRFCQRGLGWRGDGGIGAIQAMYHLRVYKFIRSSGSGSPDGSTETRSCGSGTACGSPRPCRYHLVSAPRGL
jgi:hypothetical protein